MRPVATKEEFDKYFNQIMTFLPGKGLSKEAQDKSYAVYQECMKVKNKVDEKSREEYLKADIFKFVVTVLMIDHLPDIEKEEK